MRHAMQNVLGVVGRDYGGIPACVGGAAMNDNRKLIDDLRTYADWADGNEWYIPIDLPDLLREAANMIEQQAIELAAMRSAARSLKMALDELKEGQSSE